jgi:uncharacterized protein (TIGR03067 family)
MKARGLILLALGLPVSANAAGDGAAAGELKKLAGTWQVAALEVAGKAMPEQDAQRMKIVIQGSRLTVQEKGKPATAMGLRVDPGRKPKALDLIITQGGESVNWKCIYALEGETLKICIPLAPKKGEKAKTEGYGALKQPESFDAAGKPFMVLTAKRARK